MRVTAPYQNAILDVMLKSRKPMSLREITNQCQLTYHQVASCLIALKSKGYVRRVRTGLYEATEEAKLLELSPENQILILKNRVIELENEIKSLLMKLAKAGNN
jgi:DNA-binding IclR family transcriptional regulator